MKATNDENEVTRNKADLQRKIDMLNRTTFEMRNGSDKVWASGKSNIISNQIEQQNADSNMKEHMDSAITNSSAKKRKNANYEMNINQEKKVKHAAEKNIKKHSKKKSSKLLVVANIFFYIIIVGILAGFFMLYGPIQKFRDWYITTAMTTMTHQYLATWFYDSETINSVLDNNKVVEVDGITDVSKINTNIVAEEENTETVTYANEYEQAVLEKNQSHPEYKIIDITGNGYKGYLAIVYDASKIHAMVTKKLGTAGEYVTAMAEENNAVLAINGGGFEDPNYNGTGGKPLGLTIVKGKTVTNYEYSGAGGMIGFDTSNNLVLGKVSSSTAQKMNIRDAVTCGPFLIINGEASKVVGNGGWGTAPRTAIGQRQDGIVLMLVIDGRQVGCQGADMDDLIEIMQRYGAYNAAALDGGTSTVMVENNQVINDPVNGSGKHKTRPIATAFGLMLDDEE